jgi:hypothetical protein
MESLLLYIKMYDKAKTYSIGIEEEKNGAMLYV